METANKVNMIDVYIHIAGLLSYKFKKRSIFNFLPKMLVDLANGSRFDSGYRLLNRCLRHVFDKKSEIQLNKKAILIKTEKNKIGIILKTLFLNQ